MPDDIFDYFGGNSSRKVEPLDESEMFEDLLPKKTEPEAISNSDDEPEIIEAELVAEHVDDVQDDELVNEEIVQEEPAEPVAANDPWNDLASSLGLEPTPKTASETKGSTYEPVVEDDSSEATADTTKPVEVFSVHREDDDDHEPAQEVLSEMFVPAEDPEAYSEEREPIDDLDDDPFAAFSGARRVEVAAEPDETEFEEMEVSGSEDLDSDPNFVEFEVKDLGGPGEEEREERKGRRRPRRRQRGGGDRADELQSDISGSEDRGSSRHAESHEEDREQESEERERGRRGGRRRVKSEERDDEPSRTSEHVRDRESRSRSRNRGRDRIREEQHDDGDRVDDRDKKKKPRVPTWQEAIGVMIDANIKRHESNTNSGRGGRRRRRN